MTHGMPASFIGASRTSGMRPRADRALAPHRQTDRHCRPTEAQERTRRQPSSPDPQTGRAIPAPRRPPHPPASRDHPHPRAQQPHSPWPDQALPFRGKRMIQPLPFQSRWPPQHLWPCRPLRHGRPDRRPRPPPALTSGALPSRSAIRASMAPVLCRTTSTICFMACSLSLLELTWPPQIIDPSGTSTIRTRTK